MKRNATVLLLMGLLFLTGCSSQNAETITRNKQGVIVNEEWQGQEEFRASDKTDGYGQEMKIKVTEDNNAFRIYVVSAGRDGVFYTNDDIKTDRFIYKDELKIRAEKAAKKKADAEAALHKEAGVDAREVIATPKK